MRGVMIFIVCSFYLGCATGPANKIRQSNPSFTGGYYKDRSWDDTLHFKRTSWYINANLSYDLWIAKLDKSSPFTYWLESNKDNYHSCREFLVVLVYTNSFSRITDLVSPAEIKSQIIDLGYEEVGLSQFRGHLAAHNVFFQWNLNAHKAVGFCYRKMDAISQKIPISMPGFKTINTL